MTQKLNALLTYKQTHGYSDELSHCRNCALHWIHLIISATCLDAIIIVFLVQRFYTATTRALRTASVTCKFQSSSTVDLSASPSTVNQDTASPASQKEAQSGGCPHRRRQQFWSTSQSSHTEQLRSGLQQTTTPIPRHRPVMRLRHPHTIGRMTRMPTPPDSLLSQQSPARSRRRYRTSSPHFLPSRLVSDLPDSHHLLHRPELMKLLYQTHIYPLPRRRQILKTVLRNTVGNRSGLHLIVCDHHRARKPRLRVPQSLHKAKSWIALMTITPS